jgi:small subunit ribosomal protein S3
MGQKVSPIGFRTGVTIGWKSRWFAPKSNFGEFLVEDEKIRRFVDQRLNRQPPYAAISAVEIERTREEVKVSLKTARPGLVIGPKGAEVDKLRTALEDLTDRRVSINIVEVRNPDLDAQLTAESIAEQLKRRGSFRRILKQRAESAMQAGAKGIKIMVGGRLGGAEIARSETKILGSIPLHTLEADVDYGFAPSHTTYGTIGVKVWIYRGMFGSSVSETDAPAGGQSMRPRRRREGGGPGGPGGPGGRGGGRSARGGGAPPSRRGPAPAKAPEAAAPAPAAEEAPAPPAEPPAAAEGDSTETKES